MKLKNKVRVVWNLTNVCPYQCPMCVASANKRFEKEIDKDAILKSILSVDNSILNIDFSGGDPLAVPKDVEIIKKASNILGKDKVSISATGFSLSKMSDDEIKELASGYDLTYDFPKEYKSLDVRDSRYNEFNYNQALRIKKLGLDVDIYIPIRNVEEKYYKALAKDLAELNPVSINFLKLMPMGNNFNDGKIDNISKVKFLKDELKSLGYTGEVKISCAMKEDFGEKHNCNMLSERKVGLDHYGDLYTCIWAADILESKQNSPFYLGNLIQEKLFDILSSEKVNNYISKLETDRDKCHVLERYNNLNKF